MRRISRRRKSTLCSAVIVAIAAICTYFFMGGPELSDQKIESQTGEGQAVSIPAPEKGRELQIQYLDVGQADATLIRLPNGQTMLIDAGGNATADRLVEYIAKQGVKRIDFLIGTHPHEDHIGGLDKVIEAFDIGEIYLPKVADSQVPTTRTYEDVLAAVDQKGLRVNRGAAGTVLFQRDELSARLLAPNSDAYDELNSYSIVVLLTYGERKFLFMGDAESDSEQEILERFGNVTADVLKCGHHGSSTSTSQAFLDSVSPEYAVISCGRDNSYGHPHQETLERLDRKNVTVYRTDQQHTVIASCDGEKLTLDAVEISLEKD